MISFEPYSESNADLILSWRNSDAVKANSLDSSDISLEQHMAFLERLKSDKTRQYFLVSLNGNPCATINFQINADSVYWGCAIADGQKTIPGLFPLLIYSAGRYCFEIAKKPRLISTVVAHNTAPQKINAYLGIEAQENSPKEASQNDSLHYELDISDWNHVQEKLKTILPSQLQKMAAQLEFPAT